MKTWAMIASSLLVAVLLWTATTVYTDAQNTNKPRWEYFTLTTSVRESDFRTRLNAQGDEGWELVTFINVGEFQTYIFKRPLN